MISGPAIQNCWRNPRRIQRFGIPRRLMGIQALNSWAAFRQTIGTVGSVEVRMDGGGGDVMAAWDSAVRVANRRWGWDCSLRVEADGDSRGGNGQASASSFQVGFFQHPDFKESFRYARSRLIWRLPAARLWRRNGGRSRRYRHAGWFCSTSTPTSPVRVTRQMIRLSVWVRLNRTDEYARGWEIVGLPWVAGLNFQSAGPTVV